MQTDFTVINPSELARLRAQRDALAAALQFCHDTLNANFAGTRTIEERRATAAVNRARAALATLDREGAAE
jgi:hypothetical protein